MSIKQKIKNFYRDHKTGCKIAGAAVGGAAAFGCGYLISKAIEKSNDELVELAQEEQTAATEPTTAIDSYSEHRIRMEEEYAGRRAYIREEYAEQFKQLEDFSKTLDLPDDMSAIIAGPKSYYGNDDKTICYLEGNYGEYYTSGNDEES